eukprot:COSAG06_NODE_48119_length_334_cov_0.987234_1_plen_48_part_10
MSAVLSHTCSLHRLLTVLPLVAVSVDYFSCCCRRCGLRRELCGHVLHV